MKLLFILVLGTLTNHFNLYSAEATRLRIVMVSDGVNSWRRNQGASLENGCRHNLMFLKSLLSDALGQFADRYTLNGDPENPVESFPLNGESVTPNSVMSFLNSDEFIIQPGESILFYYCGHGAMQEDKTRTDYKQHYLLFGKAGPTDQGVLARVDLRNVLVQKKAKAVYIITDACSNFQKIEPVAGEPEPTPDYLAFYELFFRADGLYDILAAAPGERAWFDQNGGMFTSAFVDIFYKPLNKLDKNQDGSTNWKEIFPTLQEYTQRRFLMLKEQTRLSPEDRQRADSIFNFKSQTPTYYFLGQWPQ